MKRTGLKDESNEAFCDGVYATVFTDNFNISKHGDEDPGSKPYITHLITISFLKSSKVLV